MSPVPEFSVLMTCYKKAPYVAQAITSVLNQTDPSWELVIVDDTSTDNSVRAIAPFLKDSRVRHVRHEENRGVSVASRTAVQHSSGPLVGLLDGDDALRNDAIEVIKEE